MIQGQTCGIPARPKRYPPPFWTVWMGRVIVVFLLILPEIASARTDFDRMEQLAATEYGQIAVATVKAWRTMIEKNRTQPDLAKLERTNIFVNDRILYASDMSVWGVEDYWATPLELFGKGRGDCEDYAIAKYVSLLLMDVPVQRLRLVYARARMGSQTVAHLVLSYYETPTSDPLILDNLVDTILPAKRRTDLFPVFSFNHEGIWMGAEGRSTGDPTSRLSRWRDVLQRMRREGIDPSLIQLSSRTSLLREQQKSRLSQQNAAKPPLPAKMTEKYLANPEKIASEPAKIKVKTAKYRPSPQRIAKR
ncbi:MAG: transglutaminase-like cysteine peptidase [Azoarcus sp.]|jgi:predicted transglutaminase-like cysteine proteinase|nr:transglutaminase-like cysteine peptidase [Azoarcus sp.]